MFQQH